MWDSHLPGVSRNVGFVPVKHDGRCAWTGLDGVIIRTTPLLWAALFNFFYIFMVAKACNLRL